MRSNLSKISKISRDSLDTILNKEIETEDNKEGERKLSSEISGVKEDGVGKEGGNLSKEKETRNQRIKNLKDLSKPKGIHKGTHESPESQLLNYNLTPNEEKVKESTFNEMTKKQVEEQQKLQKLKDYPLYFSSNEEDEPEPGQPLLKRLHDLDVKKSRIVSYETIPEIPEYFQKAAVRIFSKYTSQEIKEWSKKYLLLYAQNHAVEPPMDLTKLKKIRFGNSEELNIKIKLFNTLNHQNNHIDPSNKTNFSKEKENKEALGNEVDEETIEEKSEVVDLTSKFKKKKENFTSPYLKIEYNAPFAVAYLFSRAPYTFSVIRRILIELKTRNPDFRPKSVLDYGAGLGSGILAAFEVFDKNLTKIAAIEPNKYMRKLGRYFCETTLVFKDERFDKEIVWVDSLAMLPGAGGMERGKFDLIIISHVLQEIQSAQGREMIIDTLYNRLTSEGVLVVIEPGSPKGFRFITDLRDWVIEKKEEYKKKEEQQEKFNLGGTNKVNLESNINNSDETKDSEDNSIKKGHKTESVNIIAPCPHCFKCPLAGRMNDWCHFSQIVKKYKKSIFPRVRKDDDTHNEKYSYLVIKRGSHILNRLNDVVDENELSLADFSYKWHRVLKPVIKQSRHVIIDMCTTKGKFERKTIAHSHGIEGGYKVAKRIKWGDLWMFGERIPNKFRKESFFAKRLW